MSLNFHQNDSIHVFLQHIQNVRFFQAREIPADFRRLACFAEISKTMSFQEHSRCFDVILLCEHWKEIRVGR